MNDKFADSFVTNDHYCYVTSDAYKIDGGYVVYNIWTGTEEVTVQEKGTDLRVKGDVLGYSSITKEEGLSDGVIGTIEDVDDSFGLKDGAVYGVNDKQDKVSLDGTNTNKITSDTVVLYVDTDDNKGYTEGSIAEADDFNNGKIANVMYKLDGTAPDADLALIVVDVKNKLHGDFNVVFNSAADKTDAADVNAALAKGNVTVANLPATGTVNVPAGKTLTVTGEVTDAQVNAITAAKGAKLVLVAGSTTASSTYTANSTFEYNGSAWVKQP